MSSLLRSVDQSPLPTQSILPLSETFGRFEFGCQLVQKSKHLVHSDLGSKREKEKWENTFLTSSLASMKGSCALLWQTWQNHPEPNSSSLIKS